MKAGELCNILQKMDLNLEVSLTCEGVSWPCLSAEVYEGTIDIGGGWVPLDNGEENNI